MRMTHMGPVVLILGALCSLQAQTSQPQTFGSFKRALLNKSVVINDVPFRQRYCLSWVSARQNPDGTYSEADGISNHLAITYKGQTATVIAIQLAPSFLQKEQTGSTNAFGEVVGEEDIRDPYLEVVVKFGDGALGFVRGFPETLMLNMDLAASRQSRADTIEAQLPTVIGRRLYAVGYSKLYKPTATAEQMGGMEDIFARLGVSDIPLLEPLTITKAKYLRDVDAVVLKLTLPNSSEAIAYTSSEFLKDEENEKDFLSRISGGLLVAMPEKLTEREIKAIRERSIFRGMSVDALDYAVGFKDKENDWGRGGKQRFYFDGKLVVYVDAAGRVQDWQDFDK